MRKISMAALILTAAALSACGSVRDFEWFPDYFDQSPPTVSATVAGKTFSNSSTIHVTALPASVTFTSSEAATVYYTTNGSDPAGSPNTVQLTAAGSATVSNLITVTNTVLKFFGRDTASPSNSSDIQSGTIVSP